MNKLKSYLLILMTAVIGLASCTSSHLINDDKKRETITQDFEQRRQSLSCDQLFAIFDTTEMSIPQREAMMFLYAYMPLCDIANQSGDYFLEMVDCTLKAKEEMPWGKVVPEREFIHFVLPLRVNNENLDTCRTVFYAELKDRVKGLSMHDAVLEVNHWCHEKVVYQPSDGRTSSPLASIKTAYGRCGEESTFTVSALRAVGIPARQVYTPRWAHTDSNHAWVEAWVDGEWRFFGACEPEPVLDLGWFNAPASRAMLMHTKAFGKYDGPEEIMSQNAGYTEINIIDNYAPTTTAEVIVTDSEGKPVEDATVEFKLYNYAELYSIATKKTDKEGKASLTAGKGDVVVWASKDGRYNFGKLSFGKDEQITLALDKKAGDAYSIDIDIIPPVEGANLPEVTEEQRAENSRRMAYEDSIRNAYVATFFNEQTALEWAKAHPVKNASVEAIAEMLVKSRGNHDIITSALADHKEQAAWILSLVVDKDLRDIPQEALIDHITNTPDWNDVENHAMISNPRVSNEMITPYRSFFKAAISQDDAQRFRQSPADLAKWVADSIRIDKECNRGGAPISPIGVWKARVADPHSRNIFFVAMARSLDIPARIDDVTGKVQILNDGNLVDIDFEASEQIVAKQGILQASYAPTKMLDNPKYYNHFSIAKLTDRGTLYTLNYNEGDGVREGTTWQNLLKDGAHLDCGDYLMVTGTRLANGGVLAHLEAFAVADGETTKTEMVMRQSLDDVQVIGSFNSESLYMPIDGDAAKSVLSTTGRGYFVVAVLGVGQEPTNHALRDIATLAKDFEQWGRQMILLFPSMDDYKQFRPEEFPGLPSNITFGIDIDSSIQDQIVKEMKLTNKTLPMFIIADTFNRVVFISQGYTIGLGEQMLKTIHKL